ncbi:MAG: sulfatase [Acidobacteria bacterium]|nr:sulfatase [Acidobacteriota bacterium]
MAVWTVALVAAGCGRAAPEWKSSLDLADFVAHQRLNVRTQLISPADGLGLDNIGSGWQLRDDEEDEPIAEMPRQLGRLRIFAPEADVASIEVELGLSPDAGSRAVAVSVSFNREPLAELDVVQAWSTYRMEVPAELVRPGLNVLDFRDSERKRKKRSVRLRRARFSPSSGGAPWPRRPDRVRAARVEADGAVEGRVEMPTGSFLDMVFRVPEGSELTGRFSLEPAPGKNPAPVVVSVRLLDARGEEHSLLRERVDGEVARPRAVSGDLRRWAGELVRLRWAVRGPGQALLRWHGAGVRSTDPGLEPPRPVIERVAPGRSGRLGQPDVIVILLDAARADAFSPFGGPHETPAVARLAAGGTVFRQARTGSSWTLQSVTSMLTGMYADALGIAAWRDRLPDEVPSLPELMESAGYDTVLFSQHPFYRYDESYRRGFQTVRVLRGDDTTTLPAARELLASPGPTFALVHLLPPHIPYTPPEPFRGRYTSAYAGDMTVEPARLRPFTPDRPERPTEADVRYVRDRYQENVAYADSLLSRVLGILDRSGRYDDALIVLLSDHGEAFLEHGRFVHSLDLHREVLHVPLVIKWPRSLAGFRAVVDEPVSLLDLVPTLVDGLALRGADDGFQGRSLLPLVLGEAVSPRSFYAVTRGEGSPNRAATPRMMLESRGRSLHFAPLVGRTELYDVEKDPGERNDLAPHQPLEALLLRQSLLVQSAWNRELLRVEGDERPSEELDDESVEQLEALGYLN